MTSVGLFFVLTVFTIFGLYRVFNNYSTNEMMNTIRSSIWNLIFFNLMLVFIMIGDQITSEGKRTGILLHRALARNYDILIAENVSF